MTPSSTLCWGWVHLWLYIRRVNPLMLSSLSVLLPFDQRWGVYTDYPAIDFLFHFEKKKQKQNKTLQLIASM